MRNLLVLSFLLLSQFRLFGQIEEVRRITKTLCSPEFHGRGYVKSGDSIAARFIAAEFKKIGVKPLKRKYFQSFSLPVNTFPGKMEIKMGQKNLIPGVHFLVDPSSTSSESIWKPKLISAKTALNKDQLIREIKFVLQSKEYNSIAFDFAGLPADTMKLLSGLKNLSLLGL